MKKNYFVLSLILMFFGISVSYAGVHVGEQVTDASTLKDGSKILLRASSQEGTTDPAQYKWVSSLKDSMLWAVTTMDSPIDPYTPFVLEQAEGDIKGSPLFYVKNVKNNMYLTYIFEETITNEDGEEEGSILINDEGKIDAQCRLDYTSDKSQASSFAFVLATTGVDWNINGPYTGTKKPEATSMMMFTVCKEYKDGELLLALNQAYSNPWVANYTDWGAWFEVYLQNENVPVSYKDDLLALITKLQDIVYIPGSAPGCYDKDLVKAYDDAKTEAVNVYNNNGSEAECKTAYENLEAAWLDLAVLSPNPVVAGYYKFKNRIATEENYKLMTAGSGLVKWVNWDYTPDAKCVWEVLDRKDGTFLMRNVGTNEYVAATGANSGSGSPSITTSRDSTGNFVRYINKNNGHFIIRQKNDYSLHPEWANTGGAGVYNNVVAWNASDDDQNSPSQWAFEQLSEDSVEYYKKIGDQLILDQKLADLIALAQNKYDIGNAFTITKDSLVTSPMQFLSNAAHMSTDTVVTNDRGVWGTGADGGGYSALLDGKKATYFHSAWAGTLKEYHYMDIDLGKDVESFAIAYAKRANNDVNFPKSYEIYTATADADTAKTENWTLLRTLANQPIDRDTVCTNGLEPTEACRYIRIVVTETKNNAKLNGYPFFSLSGLQVYEAKKMETCFNVVNAEIANALSTAIADALKVKAGETTQEDIDKLQAALDAYLEELPDPTALKNVISEAEKELASAIAVDQATEINGFMVYPDPGTYPVAAKAEFEAVTKEAQDYMAENSELGNYDADKLAEFETKVTEAKNLFLTKIRTIKYADEDNEGNWYHIAAANNYFKLTGAAAGEMRTGILYVEGDGSLENSRIYWNKKDSITENFGDNAKWRFIQLTDSTYAIQNKGTQLYIGHKTTNPTYLTASPVGFEIKNVGYAACLFQGYRLNGEPVDGNYLHSQAAGNLLVYWNSTNFGGSTWEIHNADADRTEAGDEVKNYRSKEISNFMQLQAGKLYAMCYPVGFQYMYDGDAETCMYGINAISDTELTLAPIEETEPGQPFFYLVGNDQSLLKPVPTAADTITVAAKISDFKNIALEPMMVNGLIGEYSNVTYPKGMSALVETTETDDNDVVISRTQTIKAASGSTGWNSAYIKAGSIKNLEAVEGSITVKIEGDLDTSIKDAITDAQLGNVNVYSVDGVLIKKNVKASEATNGLAKGIYIVGNTKVVVK